VEIGALLDLQRAIQFVYVDELLQRWMVALVQSTRALDFVELGASVRGSLALDRAARAWALLDGRDHVIPEDVELLFGPVITHRLLFSPSFIATTAKLGRDEALRHFWQCCLERAPRPR
jgi:MoxR-like ATPase